MVLLSLFLSKKVNYKHHRFNFYYQMKLSINKAFALLDIQEAENPWNTLLEIIRF